MNFQPDMHRKKKKKNRNVLWGSNVFRAIHTYSTVLCDWASGSLFLRNVQGVFFALAN